MTGLDTAEIERVFREEHGRAVAVLVRSFGDIDVAEEAVQDAFTVAVQRWPPAGLPPFGHAAVQTPRRRDIHLLDDRRAREKLKGMARLGGFEPPHGGSVVHVEVREMPYLSSDYPYVSCQM